MTYYWLYLTHSFCYQEIWFKRRRAKKRLCDNVNWRKILFRDIVRMLYPSRVTQTHICPCSWQLKCAIFDAMSHRSNEQNERIKENRNKETIALYNHLVCRFRSCRIVSSVLIIQFCFFSLALTLIQSLEF